MVTKIEWVIEITDIILMYISMYFAIVGNLLFAWIFVILMGVLGSYCIAVYTTPDPAEMIGHERRIK